MIDINKRKWYLQKNHFPMEKEGIYLQVMGKYKNDWWESDDPAEVVMFQMNEPVLLVPFIKLQNALESVLGAAELAKLGNISYNNIQMKQKAVAAISAMA